MRRDVKLGLVGSLVVVVVACWYFARNGNIPSAIPISENDHVLPLFAQAPAQAEGAGMVSPETLEGRMAPAVNRAATVRERFPVSERPLPHDRGSEKTLFIHPLGHLVPQPGLDDDDDDPAFADGTASPDDRLHAPATRTALQTGDKVGSEPTSEAFVPSADGRHETHTIKTGDTLAHLARMYYGDIRYAGLLLGANPLVTDPTAIPVGAVIIIPDVDDGTVPPGEGRESLLTVPAIVRTVVNKDSRPFASPAARNPAAATDPTYVVRKGDTLYSIAREQLASGARWKEIYGLNKDVIGDDANQLPEGQMLTLPRE